MHSVLTEMVRAEDDKNRPNGELVQEGIQAWLGPTRVSPRTVLALEKLTLIKPDKAHGVRRYLPTSTARHVLARPELVAELQAAIDAGKAFTLTDDHRVKFL